MTHNNIARGFSVCQPSLGAQLQWNPAMGSQELDQLIHAYIPTNASIQEKRTAVSVDFFEFSQRTGVAFRYYPVAAGYTETASPSSSTSSPVVDSGYSSTFVSPTLSTDWTWSQSSTPASMAASTPASVSQETVPSRAAGSKRKAAAASSSRSAEPDFSGLPGMKIMTKDGKDVTNSASRGCKTKEQRDHAHLMRIIKACDACKKKKIRCDPSHKKRPSASAASASQPQASASASAAATRPTKKSKPSARIHTEPAKPASVSPSSFQVEPAFELPADLWDSFVQLDEEPLPSFIDDFDLFMDSAQYLTPQSDYAPASSGSAPLSSSTFYGHSDPSAAQNLPAFSVDDLQLDCFADGLEAPALPYMGEATAGNDYVDFNLFSPTTSLLDEESMPINDIGDVNQPVHDTIATDGDMFAGVINARAPQQEQQDHALSAQQRPPYVPQTHAVSDTAGSRPGLDFRRVADGRTSVAGPAGALHDVPSAGLRTTQQNQHSTAAQQSRSPLYWAPCETAGIAHGQPQQQHNATANTATTTTTTTTTSGTAGVASASGLGVTVERPRSLLTQQGGSEGGARAASDVHALTSRQKVTSGTDARPTKEDITKESNQPQSSVLPAATATCAVAATGLLASAVQFQALTSILQIVLGVVAVFGSLLSSSSPGYLASMCDTSGQRIHGTTPIHRSQDGENNDNDKTDYSRDGRNAARETMSTARRACRQIGNAHLPVVVGRLAASSRLLALTTQ